MDAFFKPFLRSDASRNPVLSGYFAAIVGSFVAKKQQEMLAYFFADAQIPDLFLARLDVSSILELQQSPRSFVGCCCRCGREPEEWGRQ